jgi:Holliday junction resolvase-like predicted endonuclease
MVRQYGLGYVFVDQSASLLSKVAFANSYATIALSQKLRSDVQAIASAMNLTDEQKQSLNTLPVGSAVVRLADEHPEPFLVKIPLCSVREGSVSDKAVKNRMVCYYTDTTSNRTGYSDTIVVSPVPLPDSKTNKNKTTNENITHPPSPKESQTKLDKSLIEKSKIVSDSKPIPPGKKINREEIRFLADIAARPLSTTVSRYHRLHLSRRRGNAIRQHLAAAGIIEPVTIATRSGQVVLYQLTDPGRLVCSTAGIKTAPRPRESLEHSFWVNRAAKYFQAKGYEISHEHPVKGNGAIDLLAEGKGQRIAIEVETGKSNIKANLKKIKNAGFDRIVLVATSPAAVTACQKTVDSTERNQTPQVKQLTWFDLS